MDVIQIFASPSTLFTTIPSPDYGIYIVKDPVNVGSFYVSTNLGAIYKIDSAGTVTLFANAATLGLATGTTNKAIAADNLGNVYYIKNSATSLMMITQSLVVSTVTTGVSGYGMKFTADYSTLYIAYTAANKIMKYVISTNTLTTFAGSGTAGNTNSTILTSATFNQPYDLEIDSSEHYFYVADFNSSCIRKITIN
jgi:DNA-binding beta-propeller fold protein YncE